jgi:ketosteroid isomerase-like protein
MSEENIEVVRRMVEAVNRRDPDDFVALCALDVEWEENTAVYPGLRRRYRGRVEVRKWFEDAILEPWEDFQVEDVELAAGPDGRVFTSVVLVGRGKASGVETRLRIWQVFWVEKQKAVRRQLFTDPAEAREAAGLGG